MWCNKFKSLKQTGFREKSMSFSFAQRMLCGAIMTIFMLGSSFVMLCEAKDGNKEKGKVNLAVNQEPAIDDLPSLSLENEIKQKSRSGKGDGKIEEMKEVSGVVSWIRDDVVAIEYYNKGDTAKEILVPLTEMTDLRRLQALQNLKVGDTVKIEFSEAYEEDSDGKRSQFKREAKLVDLIRSIDEKGTPLKSGKIIK